MCTDVKLMYPIAHGVLYRHCMRVCTWSWLWEKNPLLHWSHVSTVPAFSAERSTNWTIPAPIIGTCTTHAGLAHHTKDCHSVRIMAVLMAPFLWLSNNNSEQTWPQNGQKNYSIFCFISISIHRAHDVTSLGIPFNYKVFSSNAGKPRIVISMLFLQFFI